MVAISMESAVLMETEKKLLKGNFMYIIQKLNTFEEKTTRISHRINFMAHSVLENNW